MTTTEKTYADVDRTLGPVLDMLAADVKTFIELDNRIKAAEGDRQAALDNFIANSDDSQVVKLRAVIEKAQNQLKELAEKNVASETLSDDDKAKLHAQLTEQKEVIKQARKAITSLADNMKAAIDYDGIMEALGEIGDPTHSGRGRKPGSEGSSLPKASAVLTLQSSAGGEPQVHETFSQAAKVLGISVEDLQKHFAQAAGVDHADISSVNTPQEFVLHAGKELPGSSVDWTVSTKPKERKKPGPRVSK